ncbi:MAG TPA: twin-arginine translocase TatA/TatE family subunit [Solirubrobacteraceae bacterium]|nr:twin-arginine translocase TatA/TatE family subunit [Solirubrobacteraceae bacterium]
MGLENPLHIAIILVVVLMVFGAKRLPEMGKGLGEGMRGFRSALSGESREDHPNRVHELTAAEEPAATRSDAGERRSPEPVA